MEAILHGMHMEGEELKLDTFMHMVTSLLLEAI